MKVLSVLWLLGRCRRFSVQYMKLLNGAGFSKMIRGFSGVLPKSLTEFKADVSTILSEVL
ncbi:MAG: hypothetical protein ACKESB_01540 [Candidatus Hodgkinia cicadicola]